MPSPTGAPSPLQTTRTALWHLRHGGITQLRTWQRRRRTGIAAGSSAGNRDAQGNLTFPEAVIPDPLPRFPGLRVAVILDDFSMLAWSHEFHTVPVTPERWREQLEAEPVDLLLVESAWHGNADAWQYQLTGSKAPSPALRALVGFCRDRKIPTVFWNKEDPPHFEDFLETAGLFDQVFSTDCTLMDLYRARLGHDRVSVLPFAAQSAVHNPVRPQHGYHVRDVAFAGMYFAHKFPERREQMDLLLGGALDASPRMETGLEIFSRFLGDDERYQFPGELGDRVVGSLPYNRMLTAYQAYKVFLNVNSVTTSRSMCARRIFEICASGTPVVTTPSPAVREYFTAAEVPVVTTRQEAADVVRSLVRSGEQRDRMVHLAQRRIWRGHTYTHRARQVLDAVGLADRFGTVGLADGADLPTVSVLAVTNRPGQLDHLLSQVARQIGVRLQLVLVTHGFDAPAGLREQAAAMDLEDVQILSAVAGDSLGACLNRAVQAADGSVCTKMDDDDLYGPWYLHDLLQAKAFSRADVVGKHAHYMYLEGADATLLRFPWMEHRFTDRVMGPTITADRDQFLEHPFPDVSRGEDTGFLEAVSQAGGKIYGTDRYNFTQVRTARADHHSWNAADEHLMASADVAWYGRNEGHVMI